MNKHRVVVLTRDHRESIGWDSLKGRRIVLEKVDDLFDASVDYIAKELTAAGVGGEVLVNTVSALRWGVLSQWAVWVLDAASTCEQITGPQDAEHFLRRKFQGEIPTDGSSIWY